MKAFRKLLVAHIKQFSRERAAVFWTFAFPVFFILVFGAIFSGEDDASFSIGMVVDDNSGAALGLSTAFQQIPVFDIHLGNQADELQALKDGDRRAVIIIRADFGKAIFQGEKGNIEVYYDPTQSISQQVVLPIVHQAVDGFDRMVTQTPSLVKLTERTLQVHDLRFVDYLVPGILAMALMQLGIFSAAPLVVERQNRVLKRLGATPLRRSTLIISNVVFRLLVAIGQAALILAVAHLVFDVPMLGSWFFLLGIVVMGTLSFLAMGYMLSAFAKTQDTIMPLLMAVQFPMMFLSGIFFPVEIIPDFMRPIMDVMPLTYLADSLRQIMVNSSAQHSHLINIAVLGGWFVACLIAAVRFFRWE